MPAIDHHSDHALTPAEARILFEQSQTERPTPQFIAGLITRGVKRMDIIQAGKARDLSLPSMDDVYSELATGRPYLEKVTQTIAERHVGRIAVFAARDAEALYDSYAIHYPREKAVLLPASMPLWISESMGYSELALPFMEAHELTMQNLRQDNLGLIDTGFQGSVAVEVWERLARLHHKKVGVIGKKLPLSLVSKSERATVATQIYDFDPQAAKLTEDPFPRATRATHGFVSREFNALLYPLTRRFATSLQLLPRYQGTYSHLEEVDGRVTAVPMREFTNTLRPLDRNDSFVHPLAAAVVQFEIVKQALSFR